MTESSYKFLITAQFHKLLNLPQKINGYVVYIDWIRGGKKGVTTISAVKNNQVIFENIEVVLPSTIFYDVKSKKFYKKILEIRVMYQTDVEHKEKKQGQMLGSFSIPLHEKAVANLEAENVYPITEIVKKSKEDPIKIQMTLKISPIKDITTKDFRLAQNNGGKELIQKMKKSKLENKTMLILPQTFGDIFEKDSESSKKVDTEDVVEDDWDGVISQNNNTKKKEEWKIQRKKVKNSLKKSEVNKMLNGITLNKSKEEGESDPTSKGSSPNDKNGKIDVNKPSPITPRMMEQLSPVTPRSKERKKSVTNINLTPSKVLEDPSLSYLQKKARRVSESREMTENDQNWILHHFLSYINPSFSNEIPVSGYILFKSLLYWRAFNDEKNPFILSFFEYFEKIVENTKMSQEQIYYWISSCGYLTAAIKKESEENENFSSKKTMGVVQTSVANLKKYASKLFFHSINLCKDNLKHLLLNCILISSDLTLKRSPEFSPDKINEEFEKELKILNQLNMPKNFINQYFKQISSFCNAFLFNNLLASPEYCTFGKGMTMKKDMSVVMKWFSSQNLLSAKTQLQPFLELCDILCINKEVLIDINSRKNICPSLSNDQLSQLLYNYCPDDFSSQPIHPAIFEAISGSKQPPFDFQLNTHYKIKFSLSVSHYSTLLDKTIEIPTIVKKRETLYFLSPDFNDEERSDSDEW
eukprot:TRINITY_DN7760_c0_g1_i1.p1 TRINITY_DN7760_c0_g1~~TRINITY_DN7760_c0_g1_i1.p1  ORF type:complete len:698 (-),score=204.44 TRINITY_DN7760_c0_g1_i1:33-2126(-)